MLFHHPVVIPQPMPQQAHRVLSWLQDGSRAELQGVTFTGRTDLAATKDAPAISMAMSHVALSVCRDATACLQGVVPEHTPNRMEIVNSGPAGVERGGPAQLASGFGHTACMCTTS
jgi:hypothetical protein